MFILKKKIDFIITKWSEQCIFTNVLGLSRSILAFCTLLTLLFNSPDTLFMPGGVKNNPVDSLLLLNRINFFFLLSYSYIWVLKWIAILFLIVVISGWRPQFTCIIHCWISISFINSAILIEGGDQIVSNISILLVPICIMDRRKWHWSAELLSGPYVSERNLIANFFYFLIRLQVSIIYFHSAIGKMFVEEWRNGTAVYYWFNDPVFGLVDLLKPIFNLILFNKFGIVLLTWGTIIFEISLFTGLVIEKKFRKYLLVTGILFHFFIIIIHGLFSFFFAMTGSLILYLGPVTKNILFKKSIIKTKALYFIRRNYSYDQ